MRPTAYFHRKSPVTPSHATPGPSATRGAALLFCADAAGDGATHQITAPAASINRVSRDKSFCRIASDAPTRTVYEGSPGRVINLEAIRSLPIVASEG